MNFHIRRTSTGFAWDAKPCDEAFRKKYTRVDRRSTDDPTKILHYAGKDPAWWYEVGTNHRVENGNICRDFEDEGWFVSIGSLKALVAFREKYGPLVIEAGDGAAVIEIYDDYRE